MQLKEPRMEPHPVRPSSKAEPPALLEGATRSHLPPAPPMRIVTKGWWVMREEKMSLDDLKKENSRHK